MTSELGVTEHIEGDECKFAIWTGRAPMVDFRIVLKANSLETKQSWVKRLREVIQETYFSGTSFAILKSPGKVTNNSSSNSKNNNNINSLSTSQRLSKDIDEQAINNNELDPDISSLASFGSGNTTDSEKVSAAISLYLKSTAYVRVISMTKYECVVVVTYKCFFFQKSLHIFFFFNKTTHFFKVKVGLEIFLFEQTSICTLLFEKEKFK